jgi:hypothetical protein
MARKLRIQYPEAVYPVMNRGGRREALFADDADGERLAVEALRRMGWSEPDLRRHRKGEPCKIELPGELRSKRTMPLAWLPQRRGQSPPATRASQSLLGI